MMKHLGSCRYSFNGKGTQDKVKEFQRLKDLGLPVTRLCSLISAEYSTLSIFMGIRQITLDLTCFADILKSL